MDVTSDLLLSSSVIRHCVTLDFARDNSDECFLPFSWQPSHEIKKNNLECVSPSADICPNCFLLILCLQLHIWVVSSNSALGRSVNQMARSALVPHWLPEVQKISRAAAHRLVVPLLRLACSLFALPFRIMKEVPQKMLSIQICNTIGSSIERERREVNGNNYTIDLNLESQLSLWRVVNSGTH